MTFQFASETGFIIAMITFIGLIVQRKSLSFVLESTVKVIIGYIILQFGANLAVHQLTEVTLLLERMFSLKGIMPNNEMIVGISQWFYGKLIGSIMVVGMVLHLFIARFTKWKYIFLTGHHILYMASLLAGIMAGVNIPFVFQVLFGSIVLALTMSFFPAICQPMMDRIMPEHKVAIGHFGSVGYFLSGWLSGRIFGRKHASETDRHKIPSLNILTNPNMVIAMFMLLFFLIVALIAGTQEFSNSIGNENVFIYAVTYSFQFTAAVYIIIVGVRMLLSEVLTSFQGIADKFVPNAIPALDSPMIFPTNPTAVVIGFSFSLIGGLVGMFVLIYLKMNVVLPAVIAHFLSGGAAGVFGFYSGGFRGAALGSFVHGLFITFLPILLLPVMFQLGYTQTTFSESDFGIVGLIVYYVMEGVSWLLWRIV